MPQWNPSKDPELFPAQWHGIVKSQTGTYMLGAGLTISGVKALRNKWAAFRACLKAHPKHPSAQAQALKSFRCRGVNSHSMPGYWDLWVDVQPGLEELYARLKAEVQTLNRSIEQ